MNNNKRRIFSLVLLALFICLVSFANKAVAGGGSPIEEAFNREQILRAVLTPPPTNNNPNQ